jgi:hypothetical protein
MRADTFCICGRDDGYVQLAFDDKATGLDTKGFSGSPHLVCHLGSRGTEFLSLEEVFEIRFHLQSAVDLQNMP